MDSPLSHAVKIDCQFSGRLSGSKAGTVKMISARDRILPRSPDLYHRLGWPHWLELVSRFKSLAWASSCRPVSKPTSCQKIASSLGSCCLVPDIASAFNKTGTDYGLVFFIHSSKRTFKKGRFHNRVYGIFDFIIFNSSSLSKASAAVSKCDKFL